MPQDLLWECYMELRFGSRWKERKLTNSERGRMNRGLKELRDIGCTPEALQQRYRLWMKRHGAECGAPSINALAANWNSLEPTEQLYFTRQTEAQVILDACKKRGITTIGRTRDELLKRLNG